MTSTTDTIIDFIRHGEPEGGRMYRGSEVDHPLSQKGWQQMHAAISQRYLARHNKDSRWDLIISSPMQRCRQFAEVLSLQLNIPLEIVEDLTEICFGDWEGKTAEQIKAKDPDLFHQFHIDPVKHRPRGAESLQDFGDRINNALSVIYKQHSGKKILLVSHAGVMRTTLIQVLSAPLVRRQSIRFPYAGMLRLYANETNLRLEIL